VKEPAAPDSIDEDWRAAPCHKCKTSAMLWWRYCVFCGSQLPTVLDGNDASASDTTSSREQYSQGSNVAGAAALIALRKLHKLYVRSCGPRFRDVPFRARAVHGWVYDPTTDTVKESS
jgi:hypothetical protein